MHTCILIDLENARPPKSGQEKMSNSQKAQRMHLRSVAEDQTQWKILAVLRKSDEMGGNQTKLARECGVSRQCV